MACIWRCKAAEKCIHYHESQSRLPPACCYQWEYCTRLPRIGLRVLGSCNWAHITTTRQYQSQTDGCNSVGGLDTLANRALVKQLTRHLAFSPNSARRSEGSVHTSFSLWQLRSLSLLAWFSGLFPSLLLHTLWESWWSSCYWWDDKHLSSPNQRVHNWLDREPYRHLEGNELCPQIMHLKK